MSQAYCEMCIIFFSFRLVRDILEEKEKEAQKAMMEEKEEEEKPQGIVMGKVSRGHPPKG